MINIVFIDVDGTLLDVHRKVGIPNSAREALQRIQFDGGKVVLCTGRCYAAIPKEVSQLLAWDGMVVACGSHVIWQNETIFASFLPEELLLPLMHDYEQAKIDLMLEGPQNIYFPIKDPDKEEDAHIRNFLAEFETCLPLTTRPLIVNKLSYKIRLEDRAQETILQQKYASTLEFINYERGLREATNHGISKGSGIRHILERFGNLPVRSIGIGDSVNDIAMFEAVNLAIAMADCDNGARMAAHYITRDVADDGVAHALIENKILEPFNW